MVKRVLMVAYHFPPMRGSSGIQRTLKFAQYLPKFGWEPTVLTAHPRAYGANVIAGYRDPPNAAIERAFAIDAARHLAVAGHYFRASALPDRWSSWWWGAVVPSLTAIYNPDGNTWTMFPNVVLTPPWSNKYSLMLQYIGILGNDRYSAYAGGGFKGKSLMLMQFQYSFNLVRGGS